MRHQQKRPVDEINRMIAVCSQHSGQGNTTPELAALAALARGVFGASFAAINIVEEDWLRIAGWTFGALYIDMDGFKAINDRLGHQADDDVLRQGVERIRSTDIVMRTGGDEFAIFAPDSANREALRRLAQRLRDVSRALCPDLEK